MATIPSPYRDPSNLGNKIPKIIYWAIYFSVTLSYFLCYRQFISNSFTIVDTLILIFAATITSIVFCSFVRSPNQFFKALIERLLRPMALILALALKIFGLFIALFLRSIRLLFCLVIAIVYGVWPIDLIPDLILGIGWADDVVVTIAMIYIGLIGGKFVISTGIKENARGLIEISRVKTPFP